jgi:hypothetical protein
MIFLYDECTYEWFFTLFVKSLFSVGAKARLAPLG